MEQVYKHIVKNNQWHTLTLDKATKLLATDIIQGLTKEEAEERLSQYGLNQLHATQGTKWWILLLNQFKNVLTVILLSASILSGFLGHLTEAFAIAVIVLFAVILGFIQEYRAERAIEALRHLAAPTAIVIRSGKELEIPAAQVVPGDIILLNTGNRVPADARLIEGVNLKIDEAALTGESVPVDKKDSFITQGEIPLGDRKNMLYAGTSATYGRGRGLVVATGMETEFGKIAGLLQTVETSETPLQKNLDKVGKILAKFALLIVAVIVVLGLVRGQPFLEIFIFGIALAVAVVPEALPAVVTISLAIGVQRMVKRHALVRRLPAVETLGSTSIICTDKTGTLTKDEMTVRKVYLLDKDILLDITGAGYKPQGEFLLKDKPFSFNNLITELLRAGILSSDAQLLQSNNEWEIKGDPTEGALVVLGAKASLNKEILDDQFPRVAEIPFSSETKRMTTLHKIASDRQVAYSKGAVEVILSSCNKYLTEEGEKELNQTLQEKVLATAGMFAKDALRVLALAYKKDAHLEDAEQQLTFLGLVGMIDPPRPEAKSAIQKCQEAGIRLMMITGDHPITAEAIAHELGLLRPQGKVVTGVELDQMNDEVFVDTLKAIDVCARVSPAHKLKVVTVLQEQGYVVAMTGDGVNDAPALKKADIGIAMGIAGTDVSKEAAAMNLTDDNFASIVSAIEEGRIIFGNIKKYLMYLLSSNIGEIGLIILATLFGLPLPLSAVQILYINLATDGLPALALAVDPPEVDVMRRPPRKNGSGIFSRSVVILMVIGGLWSALINISLFVWSQNSGRSIQEAMTMVFVSLVLIEFFKAYNFRSDRQSVFSKIFANKWLNRAILWELLLLSLILYVPFLQKVFNVFSLTVNDWIIIGSFALTIVPVLEFTKWIIKKRTM